MIYIYDLDDTVINSRHRTPQAVNGQLNLNAYRELQTWANIKKDTSLPLARVMAANKRRGAYTVILTARRMTRFDYISLRKLGIKANLILSRDKLFKLFDLPLAELIYSSSDAEYKAAYLTWLRYKLGIEYADMVLFDDHKGVLKAAKSLGVNCFDSVKVNRLLSIM